MKYLAPETKLHYKYNTNKKITINKEALINIPQNPTHSKVIYWYSKLVDIISQSDQLPNDNELDGQTAALAKVNYEIATNVVSWLIRVGIFAENC